MEERAIVDDQRSFERQHWKTEKANNVAGIAGKDRMRTTREVMDENLGRVFELYYVDLERDTNLSVQRSPKRCERGEMTTSAQADKVEEEKEEGSLASVMSVLFLTSE